jgi:hypothetical protein
VDDQHEHDTYEILELRPPLSRRRGEESSRAQSDDTGPADVIDLGETAVVATPPAPPPRWHRWAIMAGVFLAGIAVGGYGWHARTETVHAAKVDVIGVDLRGEVKRDDEQSRFFAQIQNSGPRDVTIIDMRFPGEPDSAGDEIREVTVTAGGRQVVATRGTIDCESGIPEALEAEVRTEAGITSVSVPLAPVTTLGLSFSPLCERWDEQIYGPGTYLYSISLQTVIGSPVHHMVVGMDHAFGDVEVTRVTVDAPGFAAVPTNLPVAIGRGRPASLELDWTVTDCAATEELGTVDIAVGYADRPSTTATLPYSSILELARFAVSECGS